MEKNVHPISDPVAAPVSEFKGRTIQLIGWRLLGALLTLVTLGFCGPWAYCMVLRWETNHTYVEGQRLHFDGKGHQLLGPSLLWGLLTIVTCGVYGLFVPVRWRKWRVSHTRFASADDDISNNSALKVFGIIMAGIAVTALLVFGASLLTKYLTKAPKNPTPSNNPSQGDVFEGEFHFDQGGMAHIIDNGDGTFTVIYGEVPTDATDSPTDTTEATQASGQNNQSPDAPVGNVPDNILGSWMIYSENPLGFSVSTRTFYADGTYSTFSDSYEYGYDYLTEGRSWRANGLGDVSSRGFYSYENGELVLFDEEYYVPPNESPDGEAYWTPSSISHAVYLITISDDGDTLYSWKDGAVVSQRIRVYGSTEDMLNALYPDGPLHDTI